MKNVFWNQTFKRTQNKSELKEERVIKFKDGWIQIMQSEKQNEKMKSQRPVGNYGINQQTSNGISKERKERVEKISEDIITKSFPNLILKTNVTLHPRQWTPSGLNTKRDTLVHIIVKTIESQRENFESGKRKKLMKEDNNKIKVNSSLLIRNNGGQRQWNNKSNALNEKKFTNHNLWHQ